MEPETFLLLAALLLTLAAWGLAARRVWRPTATPDRLPRLLAGAAALLCVALALLWSYFFLLEFRIEYVFAYTARGTPWYYRMAGLWAGQKGTLLIWTAASAVYLYVNDRLWRRRVAEAGADAHAWSSVLDRILLVGLSVLVAFELLLLLGGTFERTDPYLAQLRPDGTPLQPVLRTPFMIIHPPLQFLGYAVATILFSCGITAVLTRKRQWADVALPWARWGFLIMTVGLGLGGLWAYYVLNFGGYWAWDPVETANLLAWFPLLLLVHSVLYYRKDGLMAAAAPLFAILTLVANLFAAFATRTGLWISVHAFTDPTKNFANDPLIRLLNIFEVSIIVPWLGAMLLAAILAALVAYLKRLHDDVRASGRQRWAPPMLATAIAGLVAWALLGFLDARFAYSLLFELADRVAFGNAPAGLAVLGFGAALVLASPSLVASESARPAPDRPFLDRYVVMSRLVFLGMMLLSLAFLVTFLLQVLSVNGYHRSVYDERAPIVALPILLVMGVGLSHQFLGRARSVAVASAAGVFGVAWAWLNPGLWHLLLVLPALSFALFASGLKLFKVGDPGPTADARLRWAGGLLLFGGIASMVYWGNPPSRIAMPWGALEPPLWLGVPGFALGLTATLASMATLRSKTVRAHRIGAAALLASWGFGVAAAAGVAAFLLAERSKARFPDVGAPFEFRACVGSLRREIRKTGVYLIHVALVLGLTGYAFSTYAQEPEERLHLGVGDATQLYGYEFRLVGNESRGFRAEDRAWSEVSAVLEVSREGRVLGTAPLTMWWELPRHYAERVHILRYAAEDVYLRPVRFETPERSFEAHEDNVVLTSGRVDAVDFTVRVLPGMHLVWAGLWMIGVGMIIVLAAGGTRFEIRKRSSESAPGGH